MLKLALVGKNIQHSKSPDIYRGFLGNDIQYDLLDFAHQKDIPRASELLALYQGVSITSPYKKHFLSEIQMSPEVSLLGAVNCLRLKEGIIEGENTDYLAIDSIILAWIKDFKKINVIIMGDGVMSDIALHLEISKSLLILARAIIFSKGRSIPIQFFGIIITTSYSTPSLFQKKYSSTMTD